MDYMKRIWIFLAIILYLLGIATWITFPELTILNISILSFASLIIIFIFYPLRREIYDLLTSRYYKKLYSHLLNLFLIGCVLSLVQYLVYKNSVYIDLTKSGQNTLSEQTKEILRSIDGPIEFLYFEKRQEWPRMIPLLELFRAHKNDISVKAIDIETEILLLKKYSVESTGVLVVNYKNSSKKAAITNELSITNLLLKLLRNREIKIYLTQGHNELNIEDESREGISILAQLIRNSTYQLHSIDLSQETLPIDAYAIAILGPKKSFLPKEMKEISSFMEKGGKLLVAVDPSFKGDPHRNLINYLKSYGLVINRDIIVDMLSQSFNADATVPFISHYALEHAVTKNFKGRTIFPLTSSIETIDNIKDVEAIKLAFPTHFPPSSAAKDLGAIEKGQAKFDNKDSKGPQAVLAVSTKGQSRVAVFGNSSFIINGYENISSNFNLFLNTLSWLVDDEPITSLNRPQLRNQVIVMSEQQVQLIFYFSVLFFPLILFSIAVFVYKRRQSL